MTTIVPHIIAPPAYAGMTGIPPFDMTLEADPFEQIEALIDLPQAEAEVAQALLHERDFAFPHIEKPAHFRPTTSTGGQWLKHHMLGWMETRTLHQADGVMWPAQTGPLSLAAHRAIERRRARGLDGPAAILELGAGQRLVAAGLKAVYDDDIEIHESSPAYGELEGVMDVVHPPLPASKAVLPSSTFELAYSIFASFYDRDQLGVMQNVVDSLRIGGEFFLMWKVGAGSFLRSLHADRYRQHLLRAGLELDVTGISRVSPETCARERYYIVSGRKREREIDVRSLFTRRGIAPYRPTHKLVRIGSDGPFFPAEWIGNDHLERIVDRLIDVGAATLNVEGSTMRARMLPYLIPQGQRAEPESAAHHLVHSPWAGTFPKFTNGSALAHIVLQRLLPIVTYLQKGGQERYQRDQRNEQIERFVLANPRF